MSYHVTVAKCPACGTATKMLLSSAYCPNDCDRKLPDVEVGGTETVYYGVWNVNSNLQKGELRRADGWAVYATEAEAVNEAHRQGFRYFVHELKALAGHKVVRDKNAKGRPCLKLTGQIIVP